MILTIPYSEPVQTRFEAPEPDALPGNFPAFQFSGDQIADFYTIVNSYTIQMALKYLRGSSGLHKSVMEPLRDPAILKLVQDGLFYFNSLEYDEDAEFAIELDDEIDHELESEYDDFTDEEYEQMITAWFYDYLAGPESSIDFDYWYDTVGDINYSVTSDDEYDDEYTDDQLDRGIADWFATYIANTHAELNLFTLQAIVLPRLYNQDIIDSIDLDDL